MTTPAKLEVWLVVDGNGVPSGSTDGDEAEANATAQALDQRVPQYGPYRVQKYVAEDRLTASQEWYANRFEHLRVWAHTALTESLRHQYFSIVGNGTAGPHEPPTYAQLMNMKQHEIERLTSEVERLTKNQYTGTRRCTILQPGADAPAKGTFLGLMREDVTGDVSAVVRLDGHGMFVTTVHPSRVELHEEST